MNASRPSRLCFLTGVVLLLACSVCSARDVAVVVDKGNSTATLSLPDLTKLFKGDTHNWPDGKRVTVFLSDPNSSDMKMVLQRIYSMNAEQIKNLADAHRGNILVVGSDDLVVKAVQTNPGSIGVVNVYSINSGIKVVRVDGKLPLESGYLLHGTN
jgi:ABC-type phosphate transport system substrate-binding protein